jgi:predicted kinase
MASVAIIVNGMPASGKTTLSRRLAAELDCPALVKDDLKEALADMLGPRADSRRIGGIALDTLWRLAAETDGGVVIEAVYDGRRADRTFLERGIATAGSPRVVEVFCDVPDEVAHARYDARMPARHPVHGALGTELDGLEPVGSSGRGPGWPVVRVDTTREVDLDALLDEIGAHLL